MHHASDREVEVRILVDDHRVLSTELGDELLRTRLPVADLRRGSRYRKPGLRPARECDHIDAGVLDEPTPRLRPRTREAVEDAGRNAVFPVDPGQYGRDDRRLLGGLEQYGVAAGQSRTRHPADDGEREVPRADHGNDAAPLEKEVVRLSGNGGEIGRLPEPLRLVRVEPEEVDGFRHVAVRFPPRLPTLEDHRGGQIEAGCRDQLRSLPEHPRPLRRRRVPPPGKGRCRSGDRGIHRPGACARDAPHQRRRLARRVHFEQARRRGILSPADDQRKAPSECRARLPEGLLHRVTGLRPVELERRVVAEPLTTRGRGNLRGNRSPERDLRGRRLVFLNKPRLVRGILEESPDEVSHPRDDLPGRHVDPGPVAHRGHGASEPFRHPVEDLELDVPLRHACVLSADHPLRDASGIVGCERRLKMGIRADEGLRTTFEVEICGGLVLEDRHRMAVLAGNNHLLVEVSALHKPDREPGPALPGKFPQPLDLSQRVAQVRLEDDPEVGPVPDVLLPEKPGQDRGRQITVPVLLDIDVHERADIPGRNGNGEQPGPEARVGPIRRGRLEMRGEGREFHREVRPAGLRRPLPPPSAAQHLEDLQVPVPVPVGLCIRERGLSEEVDRVGDPRTHETAKARERLGRGPAHDETVGHGEDALADHAGEHGPEEGALTHRRAEPHGAGSVGPEVLADMVGDLPARAERWEHVHEVEQLYTKVRIAGRPAHEPFLPPLRSHGDQGFRIDAREELPPALDDRGLKPVGGQTE